MTCPLGRSPSTNIQLLHVHGLRAGTLMFITELNAVMQILCDFIYVTKGDYR